MSSPIAGHLEQITAKVRAAPHLFLYLDYDGTLTNIVNDPRQAILSSMMREEIVAWTTMPNATPVILSGRARHEVEALVQIPDMIYGGNHGLDVAGPGIHFIHPQALEVQDSMQRLANRLVHESQKIRGSFVENKLLTLSIHYRQVDPGEVPTLRNLVESSLAHESFPIQLTHGNNVFELRPDVEWDKGRAATLIRQLGKIPGALGVGLGDDQTDEDLFRALSDGITIRVGYSPTSRAHYYVESQADVLPFLRWMRTIVLALAGREPPHEKQTIPE